MAKPWAATEDIFLLKNKGELSNYEIGQVLDRDKHAVQARLNLLSKSKRTIEEIEHEEEYILANYKTQTRAEIARAINISTTTATFRILALEQEGKLDSKEIPVKEKYKPRLKDSELNKLDKPIDKMPKQIRTIVASNEGVKLDKVKIKIGKTYEITVNNLRDNSTRYINYFKGKAIYDGPHFIVFRSKLGYNESFLKSSIAIREVTIKEVAC